ncbi:hypothetical protein ABFV55_27680, partial [Pseudomonas syringae]|uniref:hypothetical protein n=1 Tax=Pseudomonas syringae TaxID=317 RepID=UPI0034D968DF
NEETRKALRLLGINPGNCLTLFLELRKWLYWRIHTEQCTQFLTEEKNVESCAESHHGSPTV